MATDWNFVSWYEEHGNELNTRRKDRYKSDPLYKAQVLETNRLSRDKRRIETAKETAKEKAAKKVVLPPKNWKEFEYNDKDLFSIGYLAKVVGRSVQVIRLWEQQGIIKPPVAFSKKNDRLYSEDEVLAAYTILKDQGKLGPQKNKARKRNILMRVRMANGEEREEHFYPIGVFAAAIGRSVVTVEQMERRDALPATPFRTPSDIKGHRVYTADMIEVVKNALDSRGGRVRGDDWKEFKAEVVKGWTEAKVLGGTVKVLEVLSTTTI